MNLLQSVWVKRSVSSTPMLPELPAIPQNSQNSIRCLEVSIRVIPYLVELGMTNSIVMYNIVAQGDIAVIFMNCQIFGFNLGTTCI